MTGVMDDTTTIAEPEQENGQVIPVEDSNANLLGLESRDITGFILLLIPFTLSWTLGYLGFSSFWTFMITVAVYWATSNQTEYDKRHKKLEELLGLTSHVAETLSLEERQQKYKSFKDAKIPNRQVPAHLMHNDVQRAEWLNMIVQQMWPFISDFIKRILRETVEPSVKSLLPQLNIQFTEIHLGKYAPRITSVKVYEPKDGDARDRIELDCQIAWVSSAQIKLKILASTAEIEKLQFFGNMRITLEPLLSEPPLLGGMSFTFLRHPDIEYQLSGLAAVANAPGIKAAVQRAVNDAIATYLVMPNRIDVPIATLETNMLHFRLPEGVVRVSVIQASDLHNMDSKMLFQGKSDPYARVKVGSEERQTPVIDSNLNPVWADEDVYQPNDYVFDFPVHDIINQQIIVELWDKDNDADDFLGECKIQVSDIYNSYYRWQEVMEKKEKGEEITDEDREERGYFESWQKLEGKGIKRGKVRLAIYWMTFKCDDDIPNNAHAKLNKYFLGVFINSVNHLPDNIRGRQVQVELQISDTKDKNTANKKVANNLCQTTHPAVAPDCSFAETKWFFLQKAAKFFHYQITKHTPGRYGFSVNQTTQDKIIASYLITPDQFRELLTSSDKQNLHWSILIEEVLPDQAGNKTTLKSTVALRRLDGHSKAFLLPKPIHGGVNPNRPIDNTKSPNISMRNSSQDLNKTSSMATLYANPDDFRDRKTLTHLNITWRYSPNSEIFTIILHSVSNDFPAGAKIKFRNGRKFIDSAHLEKDRFKDIEEKLNLKKIHIDNDSKIDCLVRFKRKTLGIGQIDLTQDETQDVQIHEY